MKRFYKIAVVLLALCCVGAQTYLPHRRGAFRASGFTYYSTEFDATNYVSISSATGLTNSDIITISTWFKPEVDGVQRDLVNMRAGGAFIKRIDTGTIRIQIRGTTSNPALRWDSADNGFTSAGGWRHIIISADHRDTGKRWVYVNGTNCNGTWTTYLDELYDLTGNPIIRIPGNTTASIEGKLSEPWISLEYIDLSSDIAKFISGGKPVDLGADGSTPTGNQPIVYFHDPYDSFESNSGYGGDGTVTGILADGGADIP